MTNSDMLKLGLTFLLAFVFVALGVYFDPKPQRTPAEVCGGSDSRPVTIGSVVVVGCR